MQSDSQIERVGFGSLVGWTEKQREALATFETVKYGLYGGARGGGKSYFLRWYALRTLLKFAQMGLRGVRVCVACEDYPSLYERQIVKIEAEFPAWLGYYHKTSKEFRLDAAYGGGVIAFRNLDDPSKYQSAEFASWFIDEITKNDENIWPYIEGSCRWPGIERDIDLKIIGASNPDGKGQKWVRSYFLEKQLPEEMQGKGAEKLFGYVPAKVYDNPYLPPAYRAMLDRLPTKKRKAWLEGDWYVLFEGLVFDEFSQENIVTVDPDPRLPIEVAFDDGWVDPRAILLIQRTATEILVFDELYQSRKLAEESVGDLVRLVETWPYELPEELAEEVRYNAGVDEGTEGEQRAAEDAWLGAWQEAVKRGERRALPEIAVGSPEAKSLQKRFRKADIAVRTRNAPKIIEGIDNMRELVKDGEGYRALRVHSRCVNFISEITEGYIYPDASKIRTASGARLETPIDKDNHAIDAFKYWAWKRARGESFKEAEEEGDDDEQ